MKLSLSELRAIIREEAHAAEQQAPDAGAEAPAADGEAPPQQQLPSPNEDAMSLVSRLGLTTEPDASGEMSTGMAFAAFLTLVEQNAPGSIGKLSDPSNVTKMLEAMADMLTLEVLEITNVQIEGVPSKEEFKKQILGSE